MIETQNSKSRNDQEKIVFLDRGTLPPDVNFRRPAFPHEWLEFEKSDPAQIEERCNNASIIITNKAPLTTSTIKSLPTLRHVAVAATGTDIVDVAACTARGVVVSNIRNYALNTVPEHTFALILALRRSILAYRDSVKLGRWQQAAQFCYFDFPISNLAGTTLGVIGDGPLGKAVAELGKAFGMRVLMSAYKGSTGMGSLYVPFVDVLTQSDVITIHSPLIPATRNMIGQAEFDSMKRAPIFINTARGGLVDENALCNALKAGKISGAGIDVVSLEPPNQIMSS